MNAWFSRLVLIVTNISSVEFNDKRDLFILD